MFTTKPLFSLITAGLLCLPLVSCSSKSPELVSISHTFPPTSQVHITFDEREIPGQCRVFSHLNVFIPDGMRETEIKASVETFAMENGADYILVGMARESDEEPDTITLRSYGPDTPYLFKSRWSGWKYGFSDWNNAGPLVDYGHDRLSHDEAAFDTEVIVQLILLNCQVGPARQ